MADEYVSSQAKDIASQECFASSFYLSKKKKEKSMRLQSVVSLVTSHRIIIIIEYLLGKIRVQKCRQIIDIHLILF